MIKAISRVPPDLEAILAAKRIEVEHLRADAGWRTKARTRPRYDFQAALGRPGLSVIAEIKRSSPSTGSFDIDVDALRAAYVAANVDALSILSDAHFGMSALEFARLAADAVVPVLRKDFILSTEQIDEADLLGADAILLIVAILSDDELLRFGAHAVARGIAVLYEVHGESDLERLPRDASIVGINNRDLASADYRTNLDSCRRLAARLSGDVIKVAESGYARGGEVPVGFDAVLIGGGFIGEFRRTGGVAALVAEFKAGMLRGSNA